MSEIGHEGKLETSTDVPVIYPDNLNPFTKENGDANHMQSAFAKDIVHVANNLNVSEFPSHFTSQHEAVKSFVDDIIKEAQKIVRQPEAVDNFVDGHVPNKSGTEPNPSDFSSHHKPEAVNFVSGIIKDAQKVVESSRNLSTDLETIHHQIESIQTQNEPNSSPGSAAQSEPNSDEQPSTELITSIKSVNSEDKFVNQFIPDDLSELDPFLDDLLDDDDSVSSDSEAEFMNSILPDVADVNAGLNELFDEESMDFIRRESLRNSAATSVIIDSFDADSEISDLSTETSSSDTNDTEPDVLDEDDGVRMAIGPSADGDNGDWDELSRETRRRQEIIAENEALIHNIQRVKGQPGRPETTQIDSYDMTILTPADGEDPVMHEAEMLRMKENETKEEVKKLEKTIPLVKENSNKEFQNQLTENAILEEELKNLQEHPSLRRRRDSRMRRARNMFMSCFGRRRRVES